MAFAVGGSSSSHRAFGSLTIDARDFGVQADGNDCSVALQAAVDAAIASVQVRDGYSRTAIVRVPSASTNYILNNSVYLDSDQIGIEGEGRGVTCFSAGQFPQRPAFVLGLPRGSGCVRFGNQNTRYGALDPSYRVDLFGKLDGTVVGGANQRWGIRTKLDSVVQVQIGALLFAWKTQRQFTIEMCVDTGNGGQAMTPNLQIMGRGDIFRPAPWVITTGADGGIKFTFRTADQTGPGAPRRDLSFPLSGVGPFRISLQIDMDLGQAQAYVNGIQVAVSNSTWPAGLSLIADDWRPFFLGYSADGERGGGFHTDITFYGFLIAKGLRYKNNGAGQPQRCVDSTLVIGGQVPNDAFRYYGLSRYDTISGDSLVRFSTIESPSSLDRMVTFNEGPGLSERMYSGYLINEGAWLSGLGGMSSISLKGLTIGGKGHAQLIVVGGVLAAQIRDVRSFDGWHGIGSVNLGANYTVDVRDCLLSGTDAAYYGYWQVLNAQNLFFESYGNTIMRMVGSNLSLRDYFAGASGTADTFFRFHASSYGGGYALSDGYVNMEGDTLTGSSIHLDLEPYSQNYLSLKNTHFGTTGTAPAIRIRDVDPYSPESGRANAWLSCDNITLISSGPLLDIDGPRCFGDMKGIPNFVGTRLTHQKTFGSDCNIIIHESGFVGPPRSFAWYPGAHLLRNERPADGQFLEWRCVKEGTFGSLYPPEFVGTNPVQRSVSGLAGYAFTHLYITAVIN